MTDVYHQIKLQIMSRMDPSRDVTDEEIQILIDEALARPLEGTILSIENKLHIRKRLFNDIKKLDILQELIDDDEVTEIMVNGWNNIFVEKSGRISRWNKAFEDASKLTDIVQRIAAMSNKIVNEAVPISDLRLTDGSRVNIVMNPVSIDGPTITIRKFYQEPLSIEKMIAIGSITEEAALFLKNLVIAKYNIFISGGTGSGKTTFLNALSNYIPQDERVITIEDSAELKLMNIDNLVRLEARNANIEGKNEITIRDLIKSALRMRPDRIIVGEVRGKECFDMLAAMNTGHDGSLSTGHSNSAKDMLSRLETMVLMGMDMPMDAIRSQIASAIDIIVHLGRLRDRSRRVLNISEVLGIEKGQIVLNPLFIFEEEGMDDNGKIIGRLQETHNKLQATDKLKNAGYDY